MFGFDMKVTDNTQAVKRAADKAKYENIRHAALSLAKYAKSLIRKSNNPSKPGEAPTTRSKGGHNLRGAIFADATPTDAVIGPRHSFVGESGRAHEFGEDFEGDSFDKRSFMEPSLQENMSRFAADWEGSIGE